MEKIILIKPLETVKMLLVIYQMTKTYGEELCSSVWWKRELVSDEIGYLAYFYEEWKKLWLNV